MPIMITRIGSNAGIVWNALNDLGKMTPKALKRATKLRTDKELYTALGWLAKEGKLTFEGEGDEMLISLSF